MNYLVSKPPATRLQAWILAAGLSAGSLFLAGTAAPAFADDAIQRLDIAQLGDAEFAMLNDELYKVSRAFENDFADQTANVKRFHTFALFQINVKAMEVAIIIRTAMPDA